MNPRSNSLVRALCVCTANARTYARSAFALVATLCLLASCQSQGGETSGAENTPENGTDVSQQGSEPNSTPNAEPSQPAAGNTTPMQPNAPMATSPNVAVSTNPNLRFVGRLDTSSAAGPIFAWPGTKIIAGFSGTSLTLNIKAVDQQTYPGLGNVDNYLAVKIDGGTASIVRIPQGVTSFQLAKGLAAGNHTVEVTKRTESQIGSLQFLGFILDNGATLVPGPAPRSRHLEFVGDSGTVGYGADGNFWANRCSFTPDTENATASYGAVAADLLNADVHIIGGSGKGLYQNRDPKGDGYFTLPVMWSLTSADNNAQPNDKANINWNAAQWAADAVVVIVGGNDFSASTPPAAAYNKTAVQFLTTLRSSYPNAHLFVAISPMLDPPFAGQSKPSSSELATSYAKTMVSTMADPKVHYLSLNLDDGSRGYGCDYHLNAASQKVYGQAIATAIAQALAW